MLTFFGFLFILAGVVSFLISSIGLLRMPDLYSRIHAGAKSPTLATLLIVIGTIFLEPTWAPKLLLLAFFVLATNPLSSSVIARASHKVDVPCLKSDHEDELKLYEEQKLAEEAAARAVVLEQEKSATEVIEEHTEEKK